MSADATQRFSGIVCGDRFHSAENYLRLERPLTHSFADDVFGLALCRGSRIRYFLILARDLGYGDTAPLMTALEEVSRLLNAYSTAILTSSTSAF